MNGADFDPRGSDVSLKGFHIAVVVDNNDPMACERILVRVMGVHDVNTDTLDNAIWARHCAPNKFAGGQLPDRGDFVYVFFLDHNDPMSCVWLGWVRGINE